MDHCAALPLRTSTGNSRSTNRSKKSANESVAPAHGTRAGSSDPMHVRDPQGAYRVRSKVTGERGSSAAAHRAR
eukprot:7391278-Prymnesium_polylepis.2